MSDWPRNARPAPTPPCASLAGFPHPRKALGQHFLRDSQIVHRILETAQIGAQDHIVEIGPGEGVLTFPMAETGARITAIEIDARLTPLLQERAMGYPNLSIHHADAMEYPFQDIPAPFKVVANLPYYLTTPLLFRLLEFRDRILSYTLMVQKEVAERIVASPGKKDYGLLSITTQFHAIPELRIQVPRKVFSPVPRVDSAVLFIVPRLEPAVTVRDVAFFHQVIRQAFSHRRKVLSNALHFLPFSRHQILEAIGRAHVDPKRRPETLSLSEWGLLSDRLFEFQSGK